MGWMLLALGLSLLWLTALNPDLPGRSGVSGSPAGTPPSARAEPAGLGTPARGQSRAGLLLVAPATGLLTAVLVWPFENGVVLAVAAAAGAAAPYTWQARQRARRRLRIGAAMGEMLRHLATVAHTYRLPYQALSACLDALPAPIRPEYQRALAAQDAGVALPEALREAARRLDDNFYAHQLAELAEVSIRSGADFSQALGRLVQRYQLLEEIRAEERTATAGYAWFTRAFALLSVSPALGWLLTASPTLELFRAPGFAKVLLGWTVATALLCAALPSVLSVDEV